MKELSKLVPDAATIVAMHPSELAGYMLESLMSAGQMDRGSWNRGNFCGAVAQQYGNLPHSANWEAALACSAGWSWLEANGLICPDPSQHGSGWYAATSRAKEVASKQGFRAIVANQELPEEFLHPLLLIDARPLFLQSRFETAVFEAFKALEVAIREASGLGHDVIGVALAARAFRVEDGILTDLSAEKGERVALVNMMTGALGSYKNPSSHRRVEIKAEEARDMLIVASHLLKIVDQRAAMARA